MSVRFARHSALLGVLAAVAVSACGTIQVSKPADESPTAKSDPKPKDDAKLDKDFLSLVDGFGARLAGAGFSSSDVKTVKAGILEKAEEAKELRSLALDDASAGKLEIEIQADLLSEIAAKVLDEAKLSDQAKASLPNYPALLLESVVEKAAKHASGADAA